MNLINKNFATAYGWLCDNMGVVDQLDLSRKTGLAQNTISHILRGKGGVSLKTMRKFNEAFGNVFNMAFLRGESSVMLAADVKYDASDRETLTAHDTPFRPAPPPDVPQWADSLISIISNQIKENEAIIKELRSCLLEVRVLRDDIAAFRTQSK
jgi:transcriptional regulator with XRE-family HTH domain